MPRNSLESYPSDQTSPWISTDRNTTTSGRSHPCQGHRGWIRDIRRIRCALPFASYQTHSLNHPTGIAIIPPGGGSGNIYTGLYIVDSANNVIKLLQDWSHTLVTVAGNATGYEKSLRILVRYPEPERYQPF